MARSVTTTLTLGALLCAVVAGAFTPIQFNPKVDYPTGPAPSMAAIGDLNGDGLPDLAVSNYTAGTNTVSTLLGTGAGAFGLKTDFTTGLQPASVAIGDVNGDGKADLMTSNWSSNNISILLGNGSGGFGPKTDFSTGGRSISGKLADLNGDGNLDAIVANWSTGRVQVLLGNGLGGFGAATNYAALAGAYSLALGDFNGDGKLDVAVGYSNAGNSSVSLMLGNGLGGFGARTDFAAGTNPISVAAGDLNGDGKLDLATGNYSANTVSVLLGNGLGGFGLKTDYAVGSLPLAVAIGDLNSDGMLDVAVANSDAASTTVSVLPGDGTGSLGPKTDVAVGPGPQRMAIGDLDLDGKYDLAVPNAGSANVSVLLQAHTWVLAATAGAGGAISPSGAVTVPDGGSQSFTITADSCSDVADVLVDGVSVGAVTSYMLTNVHASHTIGASFSGRVYTIAASAGAGGAISPSGAVQAACGSNSAFSITAEAGYHIADVLVDGSSIGTATSYSFDAVAANHTINASFSNAVLTDICADTWSDAEFIDGTWGPVYTVQLNAGGSAVVTRVPAGGNPTAYREIQTIVNSGQNGSTVWAIQFQNAATYDPLVKGAILSLDYAEDAIIKLPTSGWGTGQATGPALRQDGTFYILTNTLLTPEQVWTHKSLNGLTNLAFWNPLNHALHPDFTQAGHTIEFGYFRANSTPSTLGYTRTAGIDNWTVTVHHGCTCTRPPGNMTAWFPLDEHQVLAGSSVRNIINSNFNGKQVPGAGGYMTFLPSTPPNSISGGAYEFGSTRSYVSAGPNVGSFTDRFTVDAWVKLDPTRSPTCSGTIIDKEINVATTTMIGYRLWVNAGNYLGATMGLGGGTAWPPVSLLGPKITDTQWHHVTFEAWPYVNKTAIAPLWRSEYHFDLWLDGSWIGHNIAVNRGDVQNHTWGVANNGDFRIGQNDPNQAPCDAGLAVDEVELFDRLLTQNEISALVARPKCKCRAEVCNWIQFAQTDFSRMIQIRICNDGPTANIPWQIDPLWKGSGSGCTVDGNKFKFTPASGVAMNVPTGTCVTYNITVELRDPADLGILTADNVGACFKVTTGDCGASGTGKGRIIGPTIISETVQCVLDYPCFGSILTAYGPAGVSQVPWTIRNTSNAAGDVSWFVRERPMDGNTLVPVLRLNGLPPGTPTTPATVHVPANGTAQVMVSASFAEAQALGSTHLEFLMGPVGNPDPAVVGDLSLVSDESCGLGFDGWANAAPDSTPPAARSEGTMIYDAPNNRFVLFGGYDGAYHNDVWTAALGPLPLWTPLVPSGTPPVGRSSHTAIYDAPRHRMIVFAGSDGGSYRNDVWALSLDAGSEAWTQLTPAGSPPSARRSQSAVYDASGNRMIVFGGYPHTNQTWSLSLAGTPTWQQLNPTGVPPAARQGHSAVYEAQRQRMIVFGGEQASGYLGDTWALSLSGAPTWSPIVTNGPAPSPRRFHYASLDSATRTLTIAGGQGEAGLSSDVWSLSLADPSQWVNTTPGAGAGPGVRSNAMGPGRDVDGFLYVFGGLDSTAANNDLWALPSARVCPAPSALLGVTPTEIGATGRLFASPNPFHTTTAISFTMPSREPVSVGIFDVAGRAVRKIDAGAQGPGPVNIRWDGLGTDGRAARPGIYLVKVRIGGQAVIGRVVHVD